MTQDQGFLVDFGGVRTGEFEPLPEGVYSAVVFNGEVKTSQKGTKYVAWEFKVTQDGFENRKAWLNNSLQPQALWTVMRTLVALGEPLENIQDKKFRIVLKKYFGRPCRIVVSQEEYEGEQRQKVLRVLAPGDDEAEEIGGVADISEDFAGAESDDDEDPFE